MEKYAVRNPNTGDILKNYELIIEDGNISLKCYRKNKTYDKVFTIHTDKKGYKSMRVTIDKTNFILSKLIYSSVNNRVIENDKVIHHIDLNPMNNMPNNLVELSRSAHTCLHRFLRLNENDKEILKFIL